MTPQRPGTGQGDDRKRSPSGEVIAFLLLAGVAVGIGVGAGVDWLIGTFPLCTLIGVFAGFALALYAVYLETRPD